VPSPTQGFAPGCECTPFTRRGRRDPPKAPPSGRSAGMLRFLRARTSPPLAANATHAQGAFTARGKANSHAENAENRKHSVPTGVFCGPEAGCPEIALPLLVNAPHAHRIGIYEIKCAHHYAD